MMTTVCFHHDAVSHLMQSLIAVSYWLYDRMCVVDVVVQEMLTQLYH